MTNIFFVNGRVQYFSGQIHDFLRKDLVQQNINEFLAPKTRLTVVQAQHFKFVLSFAVL